jgi:predicted secreted protein
MRKVSRNSAYRLSVLALLAVLILTAACGGKEKVVTWADNGRRLECAVGQVILVQLPADPSTGNTWMIDQMDEEALKPVIRGAYKANEDGEGGIQEFRLECVIGRDVDALFGYRPASDKTAAPTKVFSMVFAIR